MKKIFLLLIVCCQLSVVNAQRLNDNPQSLVLSHLKFSNAKVNEKNDQLSGSLNVDSKIAFNHSEKIVGDDSKNFDGQKKSPWFAAALSFGVPGAGEFYSESYIKAAVFVAIEAASIVIGLKYNTKGDDQTTLFQNYADAPTGWSVDRYAKWTVQHAKSINSDVDPTKYQVFQNGKVNWNELNKLESAIGQYYSHQLPKYGEQQYYELIGKYQQFNVGWYQFGDDVNKSYTYGDPLVPQFHEYAVMRGQANDYYDVAAKAVVVIVVNHIISAADAAWSASRYNKDLEMHASIEKFNYGFNTVYYPQLNLQFRF